VHENENDRFTKAPFLIEEICEFLHFGRETIVENFPQALKSQLFFMTNSKKKIEKKKFANDLRFNFLQLRGIEKILWASQD